MQALRVDVQCLQSPSSQACKHGALIWPGCIALKSSIDVDWTKSPSAQASMRNGRKALVFEHASVVHCRAEAPSCKHHIS